MKFLGLFARSAAGTAVASLLFNAILIALFYGVQFIAVAALPLIVQSAMVGVIFGLIYSLVHIKREPTLLSSFGTGIGYGVLMIVVSIVLGTFAGLSIGSLVGTVVVAAILGGGALLGTRIGKSR